jgi:hypothetical protein
MIEFCLGIIMGIFITCCIIASKKISSKRKKKSVLTLFYFILFPIYLFSLLFH